MKKIVKALNKYFKDKEFATLRPDNKECIDFPFGIIVNCKEGFIASFSLDIPSHLVYDISSALKDFKILIDSEPVYYGEAQCYEGDKAYIQYIKDLAWEHLNALIID
jgi:hypothetical protein